MTHKVTIRKYESTDARALADIYYHTIHCINIHDYSEEQVNAWAPLSSLELDGWENKWAKLAPIVAVMDDKVVGFAEFESSGHIDCFYVHHEYQGRGVGTILLEAIEGEANKKNIHRIYAKVSITAKPFFESKGFHVIKKQSILIRGCELVNFLMEKSCNDTSRTNHISILKWATDCLISKGYSLQYSPEIILETPWSIVIRFSTTKGNIFLKQTPRSISMEPKIIQLLFDQMHASVPIVIAVNDDLDCFLMKDAGLTLRQHLKTEFEPNLLYQAIKKFTTIQRSTEHYIESFLALGVPDWRLDKLPKLYNQMINQTEFLKAEGITDKELQILLDLKPKIAEQCNSLSQYQIPETIVQPDFNTNNILFDRNHKKMTLIDLGEIAITHPFFSLHNFLLQATIHHDVKEFDQIYYQLQDTCFENWLDLAKKNELLEAFMLSKKLWPIYSALATYRLMISVDPHALKVFYANRPNQFARHFREYISQVKMM